MLGVWCSKAEGYTSIGETWKQFDKHVTDYKSKREGKHTKYFIPTSQMTEKALKNLSSRVEELPDDDVADIVEGILGDVSGASFAATSEERLREAQIANTIARTKMLRRET